MKTYKVYLNIYDFMGGNGCLEAIGLGAFHTGVEIGYLCPQTATTSTATAYVQTTLTTRELSRWTPKLQTTSSTESSISARLPSWSTD